MRKTIFLVLVIFLIAPPAGILAQEAEGGEAKSTPTTAADATKVKLTIYKMQNIGFFLERYHLDKRMYPDTVHVEELGLLADLNYFMRIPVKDAWGHLFRYERTQKKEGEGISYYKVICVSPDGKGEPYIVYSNGFFIKYPEAYKYLFD
jgi:hypothetical protein